MLLQAGFDAALPEIAPADNLFLKALEDLAADGVMPGFADIAAWAALVGLNPAETRLLVPTLRLWTDQQQISSNTAPVNDREGNTG